jgi:hypothetical protein
LRSLTIFAQFRISESEQFSFASLSGMIFKYKRVKFDFVLVDFLSLIFWEYFHRYSVLACWEMVGDPELLEPGNDPFLFGAAVAAS